MDNLLYNQIPHCINCDSIEYNYSRQVGDTVYPSVGGNYNGNGNDLLIGSVDSVLVGTSYRKTLNIYNYNFNQYTGVSLIEGIGSTQGLLEGNDYFEQHNQLVCYSVNNYTLYPDSISTCGIITGIDERRHPSTLLNIYPNPCSNQVNIESTGYEIKSIAIYSLSNKPILSINNIQERKIILNTDELTASMYILRVIDIAGNNYFRKIVVVQ